MFRAPGGFRTWLATLAVAASALLVAPTAAHASGAGTLAADVNAARASAGLRTLTYDGSLSAVAQSWASHMAATDQLAHNPSTSAQIRAGWSAWGENVGFTTTGSASALHQAFMASPDHRANILNRSFTSLGVGWATKNGHTYVAEVFAAYPQAASSGSSKSGSGSSKSSGGSASSSGAASSGGSSSPGSARSSATTGTTSRTAAQQSVGATPATPPVVAPVHPDGLVRGDTGPKVRAMQVRLGVHGHAVRVDGAFGPRTNHAVRAFQHDAGLTVDGIVGPRTRAALARPAPKKPAAHEPPPSSTPSPTASAADAARTTPSNAAALAPGLRAHAAARADTPRLPLTARDAPTVGESVFATPVAFSAAGSVAAQPHLDSSGPGPAAVLGAALTLVAAVGAAATWAVRRRRAG